MRSLPRGTVTFLFTDIEGSTRLLHEHGDRYAELLSGHRRVVRETFARHGGVEVDTQGDAFFIAFPTAPGALDTAREAQAGLAQGPIRVRMGIHTGTPHLTGEGYVGQDVHKGARIAAAELVPEFRNGVFWAGLATLRDPALVLDTVAQTVGAKDGLAEHVVEREMLLLLDNFEQVMEAAPELSSLVERCPNLKLLVTSRELLRVRGEVEYAVPPLARPEAVELFCARSGLEADETIAELCRRLDNLPLAVELAAARPSAPSP